MLTSPRRSRIEAFFLYAFPSPTPSPWASGGGGQTEQEMGWSAAAHRRSKITHGFSKEDATTRPEPNGLRRDGY